MVTKIGTRSFALIGLIRTRQDIRRIAIGIPPIRLVNRPGMSELCLREIRLLRVCFEVGEWLAGSRCAGASRDVAEGVPTARPATG